MKICFFNDRKQAVIVGIRGFFDSYPVGAQQMRVFEVEIPEGCIPFFKIWENDTALLSYTADTAVIEEPPMNDPEKMLKSAVDGLKNQPWKTANLADFLSEGEVVQFKEDLQPFIPGGGSFSGGGASNSWESTSSDDRRADADADADADAGGGSDGSSAGSDSGSSAGSDVGSDAGGS